MTTTKTKPAAHPGTQVVLAALFIAATVFVVDLRAPHGVVVATLYVVVVLLGLWSPRRGFTVGMAATATLLTLLSVLLSPPGGAPWLAVINRPLALVAIWTTALAVVRFKTAESRLVEERRQAASYLDIAAVAIVALDTEGRIVLVNPKGCELLGRRREEVLGQLWIDRFVPESHRSRARAVLDGLLAGELAPGHHFEHPVATPGDGEKLVAWRGTVTRDATGRLSGTLISGEDITERRKVETLLESVLDSAPLALLAVDRSASVTLAEGKGLERMGFDPPALLGASAFESFRDLPWLTEPLRRALGGESSTMTGEREGSWYEVHGTPLRDAAGDVAGGVAVSLDITKRTRAEAALRKQQALAQLGEMAAVVAHEVRNPLAGIRATLQVLAKRLPVEDQPTVGSLYARIDALNDMTENLLLFARPRASRPEPFILRPLLREAAGLLTSDPRWSAIDVEMAGDDARIRADPLMLRGVFLNLFQNAAEAMGGRGRIRVSVDTADGSCRVSVADSGPGIPAPLRERVFEPFFTTRHRGTGLGLAVVRQRIEAQGGEVYLECPPNGGAVVTVVMPLEDSPTR